MSNIVIGVPVAPIDAEGNAWSAIDIQKYTFIPDITIINAGNTDKKVAFGFE